MINPFRTAACAERYSTYIQNGGLETGCVLCEANDITGFVHWRIIPNNFPYDRIAKIHHMIVPRRHVQEEDLTAEERDEFARIKKEHLQSYQYMIETTHITKSVPKHFHLHLIISKEIEC